MQIVNVKQGTPEWHAHRATALNASDAPVMMGISKYKTRAQLIKERATGILPEVNDATQRRFNDGHRFEALARPLAEEIIGEELSPVTGTDGTYSASFDGLPFDNSIPFEHKCMNNELRSVLSNPDATGIDLDLMYRVQMEQQLMVCGGEKVLFMASSWDADDKLLEVMSCWYFPDVELRARIVSGWEQFAADVAAYQPEAAAVEVVADAVIALPSLAVQIKGEVTTSNLPVFVSAADTFLAGIKTELETDQDFANAEANVKACKAAEDGIEQTKKSITAQAVSIDEVMRTMDLYKEKLAAVRLKLDKLVKSEKDKRKEAIIEKARIAFNENFVALEAEIKPIRLIAQHPDFAGAMKGLKKLTAMQAAVDTALRDGIFAAEQVARDMRTKLAWCEEFAAGMSMLFPDLQQLVAKPMDDFTLAITSRIEKHKADEAARLESERARMQAEEEAKARAKVAAEAAEASRKEELAKHVTQFDEKAGQPDLSNGIGRLGAGTVVAPEYKAAQETLNKSAAETLGVVLQIKPSLPDRSTIIRLVAEHWGMSIPAAHAWLRSEFSEVTA